ncbi:MAG: hypothetical protein PWP76_779 [Candidatus Diapherotrites archaeon]|nr:hypothetical protein [Candidatus Diapherotrites archaeon]MDN5366838.1 hypothetical protein [Candidatus Diapherotrites archaeon]
MIYVSEMPEILRELRTRLWAKKETAKARLKRAHVIIVGETHFGADHDILERELIKHARPTIIASEALVEREVPAEGLRRVARNFEALESKIKEAEKRYGVRTGFRGFGAVGEKNARKILERMGTLLKGIHREMELAASRGDEKAVKEHSKMANAVLLAMNAIAEKVSNPAVATASKEALNYSMAPVVGIDSQKKLKQVEAARKGNMKEFRKYQVIRNRTMAKNLEELVKRGHRPVAIVGRDHAVEIAKELEKKGIRTHVVLLPAPLESAKSVEELVRKMARAQEYEKYVLKE